MKRFDQGRLHPLIEHPETDMSQPGIEPSEFFGPQVALAYRLDAISLGPKISRIPGPNHFPLALVMDMYARIQNIMHGAV
jgi:hypothetical protein